MIFVVWSEEEVETCGGSCDHTLLNKYRILFLQSLINSEYPSYQ